MIVSRGLSPDPPIGAQGGGQSTVRESARPPACTPIPCMRDARDYDYYYYYYRQPGAPDRHRCPDPCRRPGRRRALKPRIRREFRPREPRSMERTSQYGATCGGQTYGALMFAVRCAPHTSMISISKDSGNYRPSIGRDHPYLA
ncbi:hypothetical protein GCM10010381_66180 [Streptomyces xantholiticus]|nr:hypothetical protein GCM10010381_66180 [Streptomyces xantholiticus]